MGKPGVKCEMWFQVPIFVGNMQVRFEVGGLRLALMCANGWWVGNEGYILGMDENEMPGGIWNLPERFCVTSGLLCTRYLSIEHAVSELGKAD